MDYKTTSYRKSAVTKYIGVSKFWRSRNLNWLKTGDQYPQAGTLIRVQAAGYSNNSNVGRVNICYYVKFKGVSA